MISFLKKPELFCFALFVFRLHDGVIFAPAFVLQLADVVDTVLGIVGYGVTHRGTDAVVLEQHLITRLDITPYVGALDAAAERPLNGSAVGQLGIERVL